MLVGDGTRGQERKVTEKEMGQEKEVAEYNNNIQLAATCDFSLVTIYSHHSHLHNCRDDGVTQVTSNIESGDSTSALCEGDNFTWQQTSELKQAPRGNGNKALLEGKNEDGERDNSSARRTKEEVKGRAEAGQGSTGDADVEVRMIDFAHVFPSQRLDRGYIYGLKHLLTVLEQILCDAAHCSQSSTS